LMTRVLLLETVCGGPSCDRCKSQWKITTTNTVRIEWRMPGGTMGEMVGLDMRMGVRTAQLFLAFYITKGS
jgi:hypothetical protein